MYRPRGTIDRNGISREPAEGNAAAPPWFAGSQDWSKLRKAQPAEILLPIGRQLLDQLPPEVFPGELATSYPRIINVIALHWNDRRICSKYFSELLHDQRGGRQGFPTSLRHELENLRAYWYGVGPPL